MEFIGCLNYELTINEFMSFKNLSFEGASSQDLYNLVDLITAKENLLNSPTKKMISLRKLDTSDMYQFDPKYLKEKAMSLEESILEFFTSEIEGRS